MVEAPRDLTIPEEGSATARRVLSLALGRLLADLQRLSRGDGEHARLIQALMKTARGPLASALRTPTIGTLLRCVRPGGALSGAARETAQRELFGVLALEMARSGSLPWPVRLQKPPPRLVSLQGRFVLDIPPDCSEVALENGRARIERAGAAAEVVVLERVEGSGPFYRIDRGITLAVVDTNPLAMVEAHPDKEGNAIDLGGRPAEEWIETLWKALSLIERYLPDLRAEIDLFIHQVVPVGWYAERHLSASYQEAIGTIYMSLHPSLMTMTEAVIHEFSHNKLNAFFELDGVLENAWSPLYSSPVRPDPRPLHGVLLAVHAFLPVARLYERMIAAGDPEAQSEAFRARFAAVRRVNREGASVVLAHGKPTAAGAGLLDEIRRWDAYYARFDASG